MAASVVDHSALKVNQAGIILTANYAFLTRSTATSAHTVEWEDGRTYPVIDVEVSSASHPFYTGNSRVVDTAGRVERFNRRYQRPTTGD